VSAPVQTDHAIHPNGFTAGATNFDTIAAEYDHSLPPHVIEHYLRKRSAFIRRLAAPGPALEVGCGTGLLAGRLSRRGFTLTGLDPSRGMLDELVRRFPEVKAVVGSGTALPFAGESFALTYCVAVMHHIAEPDAVRQTLAEMVRVTQPGGRVIVWDHNPLNPYWPLLMARVPQDTGAERLIPAEELVDGLTAAGARVDFARQLGLVPDFMPAPLVGAAAVVEGLVERAPAISRFCAHNVVVATRL
jgi:SAM-dependent methyltransferase